MGQKEMVSEEPKTKYDNHQNDKENTKKERDAERNSNNAVVCFDLQNVIACPRANVSNFFYKRTFKCLQFNRSFIIKQKKLTLWSDSCVPQNKNSVMVSPLKKIMTKFPNIEEIEQKLCTSGHSSIQEVDNVHSHIEKALNLSELFS